MIKINFKNFIALFTALFVSSCITSTKGIVYDEKHGLRLDVYSPKKINQEKEVLIFIHGGNWRSGKRSTYSFFGKGFARKGIVTVVIDYRLSPLADYAGMTEDAAKAVKWVKESVSKYGGDSSRIFLAGHSAGGHLAALAAMDSRYFNDEGLKRPLKGLILIDAFGLDMYAYLKNSTDAKDSIYLPTFSKDPQRWKEASPVYYIDKNTPPVLLFVGGKTYPAIRKYSDSFLEALKHYQPGAKGILVKGKKHVPMIAQFYNPQTRSYQDILNFIRASR